MTRPSSMGGNRSGAVRTSMVVSLVTAVFVCALGFVANPAGAATAAVGAQAEGDANVGTAPPQGTLDLAAALGGGSGTPLPGVGQALGALPVGSLVSLLTGALGALPPGTIVPLPSDVTEAVPGVLPVPSSALKALPVGTLLTVLGPVLNALPVGTLLGILEPVLQALPLGSILGLLGGGSGGLLGNLTGGLLGGPGGAGSGLGGLLPT